MFRQGTAAGNTVRKHWEIQERLGLPMTGHLVVMPNGMVKHPTKRRAELGPIWEFTNLKFPATREMFVPSKHEYSPPQQLIQKMTNWQKHQLAKHHGKLIKAKKQLTMEDIEHFAALEREPNHAI